MLGESVPTPMDTPLTGDQSDSSDPRGPLSIATGDTGGSEGGDDDVYLVCR